MTFMIAPANVTRERVRLLYVTIVDFVSSEPDTGGDVLAHFLSENQVMAIPWDCEMDTTAFSAYTSASVPSAPAPSSVPLLPFTPLSKEITHNYLPNNEPKLPDYIPLEECTEFDKRGLRVVESDPRWAFGSFQQ